MSKKNDGLRWQRTSDALKNFVSRFGTDTPRRAVLLTYEVDIERFQVVLLPELTRRGRQFRTLVLADSGALQSSLRRSRPRNIGRFELGQVRAGRGVFHPKLVFVCAGKHRLVGVGSANLTAGGLGSNLELMLFADNQSKSGRWLVGGAASFLDRLLRHRLIQIPRSARDFLELAIAGIAKRPGEILDSLGGPLLGQMATASKKFLGTKGAARLAVMSPWHSSTSSTDGIDPGVLQKLGRAFGNPRMTVYTDGRNGRGPNLGRRAVVHVRSERIVEADGEEVDEVILASERRPTRLHAKAYLLESHRGSPVFFWGSANCTHPALTQSVAQGGNVEIMVASKLHSSDALRFQSDLADLFTEAKCTIAISPQKAPAKPVGAILAGYVSESASGIRLQIEAPTVRQGAVLICHKEGGRTVRVPVRDGTGLVSHPKSLAAIFHEGPPLRNSATWVSVLWERVRGGDVPFPVVVPLIVDDSAGPDIALQSVVWEELGVWPNQPPTSGDQDGEEREERDNDDDDVVLLAESFHQGELDRLAVAVSVLRKRIRSAAAGTAYAAARMRILRNQVARLALPDHLRKIISRYLSRPVRTRKVGQ